MKSGEQAGQSKNLTCFHPISLGLLNYSVEVLQRDEKSYLRKNPKMLGENKHSRKECSCSKCQSGYQSRMAHLQDQLNTRATPLPFPHRKKLFNVLSILRSQNPTLCLWPFPTTWKTRPLGEQVQLINDESDSTYCRNQWAHSERTS